jgi:hypothetical protein
MANSRFTLQDFMILDAENNPISKIYIRELLDYPRCEFQSSKLSEQQKLAVIETVGLETLINVLHACYQYSGATYNAANEAQFAWVMMRKELTAKTMKNLHHDESV